MDSKASWRNGRAVRTVLAARATGSNGVRIADRSLVVRDEPGVNLGRRLAVSALTGDLDSTETTFLADEFDVSEGAARDREMPCSIETASLGMRQRYESITVNAKKRTMLPAKVNQCNRDDVCCAPMSLAEMAFRTLGASTGMRSAQ